MPKPNILFILSDQHHPGTSGFAGDSIVDTSHLDQLAEQSHYFKNAHCAYPVCTPSRMCMLTAKEAHRCSAWSNHWILFPEHTTWPGHFADHGYKTGLVGKMHLGGKNQMAGFQHRPYGDLRHGLGHQPDPLSMYPAYHGVEGAGVTEIPESLIQDNVVTRESLAFILESQSAEPERPWFLCASYGRPHSPFTAPERYIRKYRGKISLPAVNPSGEGEDTFTRNYQPGYSDEETLNALECYYACIDFVDDCIGELLQGLDRAGTLENTIIIYTSDHGEMMGNHGCWGKQLYFEDSVGVPLLISTPESRLSETVKSPVSLIDLFPTTCALAGLPVPEDLDGIDLSPLIKKPQSAQSPRAFIPSVFFRYGVRINYNQTPDDQPSAAWRSVRDERYKYVEVEKGETLLYDLEEDPEETRNLAADSDQQERCQKMKGWLYQNFSWEMAHEQLEADRKRVPEFLSGLPPGTPNQYMLPDGRVFDAEKALYDARWLPTPSQVTGGIIPQQFG